MKKITATLLGGMIVFIILTYFSKDVFPGSPLYNFKRIYEKVKMSSKSDTLGKAEYLSRLLDTRHAELRHVYSAEYDYILSASLRYSTTAGESVQFIIDNNLTSEAAILQDKFEKHKIIGRKMVKEYKGHGEDNELFLQDAVNYAEIYQTKLKEFCIEKKCTKS